MPVFGDEITEALNDYNEDVQAYNEAHGLTTGSADAAPMSTDSDLGFSNSLMTMTPSMDVSISYYRARLDVPLGVGDGMYTAGVGLYPIGVAFASSDAKTVPYFLAGITAHAMARDPLLGAMAEARAVVGVKWRRMFSFELGYSGFQAGAVVDRTGIDSLSDDYDPTGPLPPDDPSDTVRGGIGSAFDLSLGVTL